MLLCLKPTETFGFMYQVYTAPVSRLALSGETWNNTIASCSLVQNKSAIILSGDTNDRHTWAAQSNQLCF